jgi:putative ABC transport system permease protein
VVGIMSRRFARLGSDLEAFVPLVFTDAQRANERRGQHFLQTQGFLKSGVTLEQAQAELDVLARRTASEYPTTNQGVGFLVRGQGAYINRTLAPLLYVLLGAVACVLLIAGANVANLLLARATVRQREMAVRSALGAGRGRLVRQLLAESVLLAALGGGAGLFLAEWGLRLVRTFAPLASTDFARLAYVQLDGAMLACTLGFSVVTGLVFGLAPAWLASQVDLNDALKQATRGGSTRGGARGLLVVVEVALALVLLTGAGLLVRSFTRLARVELGFAPDRVAVMNLVLRPQRYAKPEQVFAFADALLARVHALPGVEAVALATPTPLNTSGAFDFALDGATAAKRNLKPSAALYRVTPEYFSAMGIRLVDGREFTERDINGAPGVAVVNQTFVQNYFPGENPIGRRVNVGRPGTPEAWFEIVGTVGDVMQGSPGQYVPPQLYLPLGQAGSTTFSVVVRTSGDPTSVLTLLKPQVYAVDANQSTGAVRRLRDMVSDALARQNLARSLLGIFAAIALVIAAVGIYAVMAYAVSQRAVEFGIRMALGASRGDILRLVLASGMKIVALGLVVGVGAAFALGQILQSLLFEISARDPATLVAIVVGLGLISLCACLLPARRAMRVSPMVALRAE